MCGQNCESGWSARTAKPAWNERKLPDHSNEEEVRFFTNWRNGLASLHGNPYFKLAQQLNEQIRETAIIAGDGRGLGVGQ
jgi:hypothetical protein